MSRNGILAATVLIILSALSAHYYGIVNIPILPSDFKANLSDSADFEISAHPDIVTLKSYSGSFNTTIINLEASEDLETNITLIVAPVKANFFGIMDNVKIALSPYHVFLSPNGSGQSTLTIEVKSLISPGNYYIDIIGVAGEIKHSTRIKLVVTN